MSHADTYLKEVAAIANLVDREVIEAMATWINGTRSRGGTVYFAGLGGSAANASHAAADFMKLCAVKTDCLTDNVAEVTARINDEGPKRWLADALEARGLGREDALMIFSVGGGNDLASPCLRPAIDLAGKTDTVVMGVVGKADGAVAKDGDYVLVVPTVADERVTPHAEAFQSVVTHLLVSHPLLQVRRTKW